MQRPEEDTATGPDPQGDFVERVAEGDEALAERAEGVPSGEGAASDAGALSVTRPPQDTGEERAQGPIVPDCVQVLLTGSDTLDLGLYVDFPESYERILRRLQAWKKSASGNGAYLAGGRCLVSPGGKPNYPYLLQYPGFILYLSRHSRPHGETPNAKLILGSQLLWQYGETGAYAEALREFSELTDAMPREIRLSRADITADLLLPGGLTDAELRQYAVTRSRATKVYLNQDRLETFYVGSGQSEIQLRIYDKSAESIAHKKMWFVLVWGLKENKDVWRFEFQLRREALKTRGLNTLEDWMRCRGALWKSLTTDWFSLRLLDNDNTSRRTIHPLWEMVQGCAQRFDDAEATISRQRAMPSLDTAHLAKQLASSVVGLGARRGVDDLAQMKQLVEDILDTEFRQRDFATACQQKAIELGLPARKDAA